MDEMLKAQLKLSLEVLSSTLTFLASPHMAETIRRFCQDKDFYETLKKVTSAIQAVEYSCYGVPKAEMVKKLVSEVKKCSDLECVRKVIEEYEEILGISHTQ